MWAVVVNLTMSEDNHYGMSGGIYDERRQRRHEKRVADLPWVLRQIDDAARYPKPPVQPEILTLSSGDLEILKTLLPRLRPTPEHPFPTGWQLHVERVIRLAEFLSRN